MTTRSDTADREIVQSRVFDAPRDLVFDTWSTPEHLVRWWGPSGFRNTIKSFDLRAGGSWTYVMHGPDGTDYDNYVAFEEVKRPERITYAHGVRASEPPHFHVEVTFTDEGEGRTRLTMRSVFPTHEAREAVKKFGAVEGGRQTLQRLADLLAERQGTFMLWRTLAAPQALVFKAFTESARLGEWWGPKGATITPKSLDLRPGGFFHYAMLMPDGPSTFARFEFKEIAPSERLVFISGFADAAGALLPPPFGDDWPAEIQNTVTFTAVGDLTVLTLVAVPVNATEAQRRTFQSHRHDLSQGYTGTVDKLVDYLARAR